MGQMAVADHGTSVAPYPAQMRIEHLAIWTRDLERLRSFYERYFGARATGRYMSANRAGFSSYFLSFPGGGSRLELMTLPTLTERLPQPTVGYAHIAVTVGSGADVEALTAKMREAGVRIVSEPRQTGDGYFESVIEDPDGNQVELTAEP